MNWTHSEKQALDADYRGWPKGQGRVGDETTRQRIRKLHHALERDPHEFYSGATAIQRGYRERDASHPVPPLRIIARMLKTLGLSKSPKKRVKGASRYLCYPEYTVYQTLGKRVLEADSIGKKYLKGRSEPLNFMMKVDNVQATLGTGSGKRCLSRFMVFLLEKQILLAEWNLYDEKLAVFEHQHFHLVNRAAWCGRRLYGNPRSEYRYPQRDHQSAHVWSF